MLIGFTVYRSDPHTGRSLIDLPFTLCCDAMVPGLTEMLADLSGPVPRRGSICMGGDLAVETKHLEAPVETFRGREEGPRRGTASVLCEKSFLRRSVQARSTVYTKCHPKVNDQNQTTCPVVKLIAH